MTKKEFITLAKQLLPVVPDAVVHGPMIAIVPMGQILRGLNFDRSGWSKTAFYVETFWLPLYVPTEHIHFTFGNRIRDSRGVDGWDTVSPAMLDELSAAIRRNALPFFDTVKTLQGVVEVARAAVARSLNSHHHQALAYTLAKIGEVEDAVQVIDALLVRLDDTTIPWVAKQKADITAFRKILTDRPEDIDATLEGWRAETIRNLKLADIS